MKNNILKVTLVAAVALFAGYNVYSSQKTVEMSDLALANVEALAADESLSMADCYNYGCIISFFTDCHVYQYGLYRGVCEGYRG